MRKRLALAMAALLTMVAALPLTWATNCASLAEGGLTGALSSVTPAQAQTPAQTLAPLLTLSPTPEPSPAPVTFEGDGLKLTLPQGFEIVEGDARAGFEAALQGDYPNAAQTLFAAMDTSHEAAVMAAFVDSETDGHDAAREAADALLGDPEAISDVQFGENRFTSFACAIGERGYHLYYFSDGARLFILGISGLERAQIEEMLADAEI